MRKLLCRWGLHKWKDLGMQRNYDAAQGFGGVTVLECWTRRAICESCGKDSWAVRDDR